MLLLFSNLIVVAMFVPRELKLNKFKQVSIPRNRDYFMRLGFCNPSANHFTGDKPADLGLNTKVDMIAQAKRDADDMISQQINN